MAIETIKLRFTGTRPLLMHNVRLSDPLDPATKALKEVSKKRNKTDEDQEEMAKLEFIGGLYLDDQGAPVINADMVHACLTEGARKTKNGKKIEQGVWFDDAWFTLKYTGPKDALGLWADQRFRLRKAVGVNNSKVMRTRPRFQQWQIDVTVNFDSQVLDKAELIAAAETAGAYLGLGDWRPQYGRFQVEEI